MTMDELDRLRMQNEERIKAIEAKYFQRKEEIRGVKEICQERADLREFKEKRVDSSLSYPTYGRGIDPHFDIDTYMINKNLCNESPSSKAKGKNEPNPDPLANLSS